MPPKFRRNDATLNILLPSDLKREIIALSLVWGDDGRISHTARRVFMMFFKAMKKDWPTEEPEDWANFQGALENLHLMEEIQKKEIEEKLELEMKELAE